MKLRFIPASISIGIMSGVLGSQQHWHGYANLLFSACVFTLWFVSFEVGRES